MKLLVVGGPAKGKTTLIEYLIRGKTLKSPIATLGVNIREWRCVSIATPTICIISFSYVCSYEQRPSEVYHLSCWDFAGQGEFYTTHQCFLTTRSLYMVCMFTSSHAPLLYEHDRWFMI